MVLRFAGAPASRLFAYFLSMAGYTPSRGERKADEDVSQPGCLGISIRDK